ncbi:SDR family NAD(P)-dependent oxidoreductase [Croceicoccus mobilis]|uniref:SDR family oxidoreductase n=1 Tax=Croceicoccus mobilis TaxID=1703339 RepID=A0A917DXC3_9SPHN|nr:SDR family NAD(P)-dependent oxidoreductase [Croceicoccus mobilis]GGD76567.1 SDR family oxidoreductase [Croceicoccus mobilis]
MSGLRCAVFGASGGIGAALVDALSDRKDVEEVYALMRSPGRKGEKATPLAFDYGDEGSIIAAVERMTGDGPLDLVIVATGLLSRGDEIQPEKTWRSLDAEAMAENFRINTIGPALIGKHVLDHLSREGRPLFAALSARVGSIEDNGLGGWHSYRAAKAALNQIIRNFAIELRRRNKRAVAVALHPGTVETTLSEPFRGNVPDEKLFTPEYAAACLLSVIDGLSAGDSGGFFAWDGKPIPF